MFDLKWQEWVFIGLCIGVVISFRHYWVFATKGLRRQNKRKKPIVLEQSSRSASEPFVTILKMDRAGTLIITDARLAQLMAREKDLGKALEILSETMRENGFHVSPGK